MVEWKKLGEVCLLKARIGWQGLTQKEHRTTGEYLLVTGTDFTSNYEVDFDHCVYVDEERYTQDPNIQLRENDVLITKDGTLGKMAVIENLPKPATLNGGLFVIRDLTGKIHHKYLLHYMLSSKFQSIIESNHTNGTIKHLTQALLTNFPIPIPSLEKQLEIVRILDTFTSSIENLKEQIAQRRKQYEYYRDQLLDLEGKEGVEMKTLGEICEFVRGPCGGALKKDIFVKDGYAIYEQQHAIYGSWSFRYYVDEKKFLEMKRFEVKSGDILMSCSGTMGKTSIVPPNCVKGIINQALLKLTAKECINNYFLKFFMDSQWFQDGLKKQTAGGAIQNVASVSVLKELIVPVPSLSEQQRIVSILDTFESSIRNLEQQLAQREKQYEYYRNKLLTFE